MGTLRYGYVCVTLRYGYVCLRFKGLTAMERSPTCGRDRSPLPARRCASAAFDPTAVEGPVSPISTDTSQERPPSPPSAAAAS
eukprot:901253-Prorocentrum_minimum.AAC.1